MPWNPLMTAHRTRLLSLFVILNLLIAAAGAPLHAETGTQTEIASKILSLFPSYTGTVQEVQGPTVRIQGVPNPGIQAGAYLLIGGTASVGGVLARVVSVNGREITAEQKGRNAIKRGDPVAGWPRPLRVALLPMSRETLRFLLEHPLPKGELDPLRTEDVLAAMIEKNYGDFSVLENMDVPALATSLNTPLVLEVKTISGFGENLLQVQSHWSRQKEALASFSVMLPGGSSAFGTIRPLAPATGRGSAPLPMERPQESASLTPQEHRVGLPPVQPLPQGTSAPSVSPAPGSSTAHPMPKLPATSGFGDPARWVRILMLDERVISMAAGSFTGPDRQELAIATPGMIHIYSYRHGKLRGAGNLEHPDLAGLFWVDAWDVNGDGTDEVIVDTDEKVFLLAQREGRPYIVHPRAGLAIRRIGNRLYAQELNRLEAEEPPVRSVRWNGEDWEMGEALKEPETSNLFALVGAPDQPHLYLTPDHKLAGGGQALSDEEAGQSNAPYLLGIDYPLFARSIYTPEGTLLIKNRAAGWPRLSRSKRFTGGGSALFLSPGEKTTLSPSFRGYLADLSLCDLDDDGSGDILISQVFTGLSGGSYILRYQ